MTKTLLVILFALFLFPLSVHADHVKLLEDPQEAWQARIDLIEQAQNTIEVEYYAIAPDTAGTIFTGLLYEAAERGVHVRILVGGLTHASIDTSTLGLLISHPNIEVRFYHSMEKWYKPSHWLKHLHDKVLLVDDIYLITGGRNIADKYFAMSSPQKKQTIDRDILIVGDKNSDNIPVQVKKYFNDLWESKPVDITHAEHYMYQPCRGHIKYLFNDFLFCAHGKWKLSKDIPLKKSELAQFMSKEKKNNPSIYNTKKDWVSETNPVGPITFAHDPTDKLKAYDNGTSFALSQTLRDAKKSILYFTPYIIKTDTYIETAEIAKKNNIRQTVLTNSPYSGANIFGIAGTEFYHENFAQNDVTYWMYQEFHSLHHKTYIVDNKISVFSTYNYDPRSQNLNTEMLFIIDDEGFTQELKEANEAFFTKSLQLNANGDVLERDGVEEMILPWYKRFIISILKLLMPTIRWAL